MTINNNFINEIKTLMQNYLRNEISGTEMVKHFDKIFVNSDINWDVSDPILEIIDKFQDVLALYVENPGRRKENSSYYGDSELTPKVKEFLSKLM